jgi:lipopolysaccharide transport system permease protein
MGSSLEIRGTALPMNERRRADPRLARVNRPEASLRELPAHLARLIAHRELLWTWTEREIKVRYSQSLLGIGWAILQPLALMLIFTLVFSTLARIPSDGAPYPVFAYAALLPWTFLASALTFAVPILVGNMSLVTKTYFPREILPLATVFASLLDFAIAALLLLGLLAFYGISVGPSLLVLPLIVLVQLGLTCGLALLGAALNVFFRDVRFVIPLVLQGWMYLSPVIYPTSLIPEAWQPLYRLNPLVGIVESYRQVLVFASWPDWMALSYSLVASLAVAVVGYAIFKRVEMRFADNI